MSEPMLRCFLAVDLPDAVRDRLAESVAMLERELPEVRFSPPENLHVTLKFLGDFPQDALPRLAHQAAARLARTPPFDVTLSGVGAFPHGRAARVLWIGVQTGAAHLARLARKLDAAAGKLGASRDRRPFRPHLTLGRLREPRPIPLDRIEAPDPMTFRVEDVVLYESRLNTSGATHVPLARLPLGRDPEDTTVFAPDF